MFCIVLSRLSTLNFLLEQFSLVLTCSNGSTSCRLQLNIETSIQVVSLIFQQLSIYWWGCIPPIVSLSLPLSFSSSLSLIQLSPPTWVKIWVHPESSAQSSPPLFSHHHHGWRRERERDRKRVREREIGREWESTERESRKISPSSSNEEPSTAHLWIDRSNRTCLHHTVHWF